MLSSTHGHLIVPVERWLPIYSINRFKFVHPTCTIINNEQWRKDSIYSYCIDISQINEVGATNYMHCTKSMYCTSWVWPRVYKLRMWWILFLAPLKVTAMQSHLHPVPFVPRSLAMMTDQGDIQRSASIMYAIDQFVLEYTFLDWQHSSNGFCEQNGRSAYQEPVSTSIIGLGLVFLQEPYDFSRAPTRLPSNPGWVQGYYQAHWTDWQTRNREQARILQNGHCTHSTNWWSWGAHVLRISFHSIFQTSNIYVLHIVSWRSDPGVDALTQSEGVSPLCATIENVLKLLTDQFHQGKKYSTLNSWQAHSRLPTNERSI
jgi:hypothetical protein